MEKRNFRIAVVILLGLFSILNIVLGFVLYTNYSSWGKTISSHVSSQVGNINFTIEGNVIFPRVVILAPQDGQTYSSQRDNLNYSVMDVGLESCWYSLDNGKTNTTMTCSENIMGITSVSGSNTWIVYANDTSGNLNSSSVTFTVSLPSAPAPAAPSGAGGGGGAPAVKAKKPVYDFEIDQALIKVKSKVGETFKKSLTIANPNEVSLKFQVSTNLGEMIFISEEEFEIPAKSKKTIFLTLVATEDITPDVYTGKVFIKTQYSEKELPVIYEVATKKALFDVSLNIPARYKSLEAGDDLFFQVTLFNLGEVGKVDVLMEYEVKDFNGKVVASLTETVAVETQASFSKTIKLPYDIKTGDYVVLARAKYGLTVATASDLFTIGKKEERFVQYTILIGILIIILILILIVYELRKIRRRIKLKGAIESQKKNVVVVRKKIHTKKIGTNEVVIELRKLDYQKELLKEAYEKGYVKKESYESGIKELNNLINQLKKRL